MTIRRLDSSFRRFVGYPSFGFFFPSLPWFYPSFGLFFPSFRWLSVVRLLLSVASSVLSVVWTLLSVASLAIRRLASSFRRFVGYPSFGLFFPSL
ncbi:hypothetical protein [Lysinibacillus sp. RS5]|uniref:hypothetical protein n=1 Tax=unclassified Lysinibacillus TaxID=2636778 RepID=UPI0035BEA272